MNKKKILVVSKDYGPDPAFFSLIEYLNIFTQLDTFYFKDCERPRTLEIKSNQRFLTKIKNKKYDIVIVWNNLLLEEELNSLKKNNIIILGMLNGFTSFNSYFFRTQLEFFKILKQYDIYFVPIEKHAKQLSSFNINAYYLPFYYDPFVYKKTLNIKFFNVGFVGAVNKCWAFNRWNAINSLKGIKKIVTIAYENPNFENKNIFTLLKIKNEKLVNLFFNSCKINLGLDELPDCKPYNHMEEMVLKYDEKFIFRPRNLTIMGSGSCLLVEKYEQILNFFESDKEIVVWKNYEELQFKTAELIKDKNKRIRIERNGYLNVINNHTIFHRLQTIQNLLKINLFENIDSYIKRCSKFKI